MPAIPTPLKSLAYSLLFSAVNFPLTRAWYARKLNQRIAQTPAGAVKIQLACGQRPFPDWINIDIVPFKPGAEILLDLRRPLPLPAGSVDLIYSEDFLEHLDLNDGRRWLADCYRILRPGGILRLLTPNLNLLAQAYLQRDARFLSWYQEKYGTQSHAEILNHGMRSWGHRFIYDDDMLIHELETLGFKPRRQLYNQSDHPALQGLDRPDPQEMGFRMYIDSYR